MWVRVTVTVGDENNSSGDQRHAGLYSGVERLHHRRQLDDSHLGRASFLARGADKCSFARHAIDSVHECGVCLCWVRTWMGSHMCLGLDERARTKIEARKDSSHASNFMILLPRTIWLVWRMRTSVFAAVWRRI